MDHERYFEGIETDLEAAFAVARRARERGGDPTEDVEIPVARDMADRVENILSIPGVADRVREMEADPDLSREEAALELARDFADGAVGDYDTRAGKVEGAVRTAVALLTEGVVAAPIEGIDRVEVLENDDGTEFVNVYYAGPIRSAGGTAQALSVLVADYTRSLVGIDEYSAREAEIERYAEEVELYDDETGLQYAPKDAETRFVARHLPVMLDGEPTSDEEVSGFRDLERVDTNAARGGMCLVLAEGIAQKAPKIERYTSDLDAVDWPWLDDLIEGTVGHDQADEDEGEADDADDGGDGDMDIDTDTDSRDGTAPDANAADPVAAGPPRAEPDGKFLRDLIAGRPVFSHPSEPGGFRLRYGRARNHGNATAGVHPATMELVGFLAPGTQLKTERPGKAAGVVPVDSIEGPTVRLANGDVRRIDDPERARELRNGVERIVDLGEYLVNYGEFVENNRPLVPAAWSVEWWEQAFGDAGAPVQALTDDPAVDVADPTAARALEWAETYDAPLHPAYTYCWHDVTVAEFDSLADAVASGHWAEADGASGRERGAPDGRAGPAGEGTDTATDTLVVPREGAAEDVARTLERLLVEHTRGEGTITVPDARPLVRSLGLTDDLRRPWALEDLPAEAREYDGGDNAVRAANAVAPFDLRERAPTRVGARMGRPEKSEERELSPAVHTLFPIGEAGGSQRDIGAAADADGPAGRGTVEAQVGRRECPDCGRRAYRARCPDCNAPTDPVHECPDCGRRVTPDEAGRAECPRCEIVVDAVQRTTLDVGDAYHAALEAVGERESAFDLVKGVKGLASAAKVPEPLEKGVLRAKHDVSAFKDGTVRYDMTDLPVTAVRPAELDVSADRLRELGYETDVDGDPLVHDDQLVELAVQDVVLSDGAAEHMLRTADFVDDLLTSYYGLDPFYEFEDRDDLVGELVFGMAPHTSAAVVGRVVGFTSAAVGYAHPYFHAAKRRNCDGDEDCVMLLMDGLLNFSKQYLPDQRGGSVTEDSRLVVVDPEGDVQFLTVEEFWSRLESPIEVDGKFRKRTCAAEGWSTFAFDDDHEASLQPIERAIRYRADDDAVVRVETQFGRSLEITEHHSLFRYDDGIEAVAGGELREGDLVVAPRQLTVDPVETTVDVAARLDEPSVVTDAHVEDPLRTAREATARGGETHQVHSGLEPRLGKQTVGLPGSSIDVRRTIPVDEEFAWLLGLFVAEGSLSGDCPTVSNADEDLIDEAVERSTSVLGHEPAVEWSNGAYRITFPALFRAALFDLGFSESAPSDPSENVIPEAILRAERDVVLAFLRGLLAGDGSRSRDDNSTSLGFHTTSDDVRDGVVFLLHRLGLVANVSTTTTDRDGNRQEGHEVSVSSSGSDNPLDRLLDGREPSHPKSLVVSVPQPLLDIREMGAADVTQAIPNHLLRRGTVSLEKLREMVDALDDRDLPPAAEDRLDDLRPLVDGDLSYLRVQNVEPIDYDGYLYDLQVGGEPVFTADWLYAHNSMDAPLVMSSRIDPAEIDDEAHNVDIDEEYPRAFYEATREMVDPGAVDVTIAEETLGTDREYSGFGHTHDTADIAAGPDLSAYKTLGSMMEKMDAQLELARKLRAVDETDVAERVIEYHFLPDLIGNLRAFSRQETRCLDCGAKYRRMPLTGDCRECGGQVNLTVHEGSVDKYMDVARRIAEEFGCREYTKQRLEILERSLESVFEDDTNKQSDMADFM